MTASADQALTNSLSDYLKYTLVCLLADIGKHIPHRMLVSRHRTVLEPSKAIPIISIVDDNEAVREAMKSLMRSLGYHASTFGSADDFLKSGQVDDTSCLITDVQMPGLSGIELQDRLIARGHHIPIIFITAYSDENVRMQAMKAGALAFLIKPFKYDHLIDYLETALKAN